MTDKTLVLKAIADETRMKILTLLLRHNYCVRALARNLELTEATISQHLKILRGAGLLTGEKRGYFMHYDVQRAVLRELAGEIEALAAIEREECTPEKGGLTPPEHGNCNLKNGHCEKTKEFCHGISSENTADRHNEDCECHKS